MSIAGWPPRHVAAAGVVITDRHGMVLMVGTQNRAELILPGGIIESGESPAAAAKRECREELGIDVRLGRLLVVQHLPAADGVPESIQFVFDSATLDNRPKLTLQSEEIAHAVWLDPESAIASHGERGRARLAAALDARGDGTTKYLD